MKAPRKPDSGMTTIETIIYIVGSLLLLAMVATIMKNMTNGFQRGAQTVRMQQGGREAVNIMAREIRNTGLKHAFYPDGSGGFRDTVLAAASLGKGDSSSFNYVDGGRFDAMTFRQARLDANGQPLGVDTVAYQVDPSRLMLRRKLNTGAFEDFCPNVDALQFQYGVYAVRTSYINEYPPQQATWSGFGNASLTFNPTSLILETSGSGTGGAVQSNTGFTIDDSKTYFCDMVVSGDQDFFDNDNSLEMVILDGSGKVLKSESFLPGRSPVRRRIEITGPSGVGCHAGIRVDAHGPVTLRFNWFRFGELNLGSYSWRNAPSLSLKKTVRAVRILLMVKTTQPVAGETGSNYGIGNADVPVSDRFLRRYFEEIVPIPNNGLF